MSKPSGTFKVAGLSLLLLLLLASPIFFFDFHSSLDKTESIHNLMQDQTYLRAESDLDTEEMDEDPRVFYLPDHKEGFASWLNEEIELPGLELPNLEIPEADFFSEEDFPAPLSSLQEDLETKIRNEWPLPQLEEERLELELKKSSGPLMVFRGEEAMESLINDDQLTELFKEVEADQLVKPSIFKVSIEEGEMDVDLAQSCGASLLDNSYAVAIMRGFYKDKVFEEVTKIPGNRDLERSDFYIIEWRLAFKRLKSQ